MFAFVHIYTHLDHPQHDLDLHSTLHPPTPNLVDIPLRLWEPLFLHSGRQFRFSMTSHMYRAYTHSHIPHQCSPQACRSTVHQVTASDFQKPLRRRSYDQHLGQSEAYRKRVPCKSAACSIWEHRYTLPQIHLRLLGANEPIPSPVPAM